MNFFASQDDWRLTARTRLDGTFQSPAPPLPGITVAPLIALATAGQDHAIAQFCTADGAVRLAVNASGFLATDRAESLQPAPNQIGAWLKLLNLNGDLIGYIPIYNAP